jgi:hypothetical protein
MHGSFAKFGFQALPAAWKMLSWQRVGKAEPAYVQDKFN